MQFQPVYSRRFLAIASFILISFSSPNILVAEEDETETLIVTAARNALEPKQVGAAYTVITREEIENRQAVFVSDLLRSVPGVSVNRNGNVGGLTQVRVRGAEANHLLVLIDGIEANDPAGGSEFDFANLTTTNIERIEIIRGPQSAIWGSDALAGAMNIITKKGKGSLNSSGLISIGSYNTHQTGMNVNGELENIHYFLGGSYYETGGINISELGNENDRYRNATFSFRGGYSPTQTTNIELVAHYVNAKNEYDDTDFGPPIDADNFTNIDQLYTKLEASSSHFDDSWKNTLQVSLTDTENDQFSALGSAFPTKGEKLKLSYLSSLTFAVPQLEDLENTFSVLVEREREDFEQRGTASPGFNPNQNQDIINYGFVTEYQLSYMSQWFFHAAFRHDDNDEFKDANTYRLSLSHQLINTNLKLYTSYAKGLKNPTFIELFGFSPSGFMGNPDLKAERSRQWEIGFEQPLFNSRGKLGISYFRSRLSDEIRDIFVTAINLQGKSKRQGIETFIRIPLGEQLDITGSFTYIDSSEFDSDAGSGQTSEVRRPNQQASLRFDYASVDQKLHLGGGLVFNGKQFDSDFSTFPAPRVELDNYTLFDVEGSYRINKWLTAFVRGENLFNDRYQEVFGYETLGRTVYGGVKVNFGRD